MVATVQAMSPPSTRPEEWSGMVEKAESNQQRLARELINSGGDANLDAERRRGAILLLGKIPRKECTEFLVKNIALTLPSREPGVLEADRMLRTPCLYALYQVGTNLNERNWNVTPVIFDSLTRQELRRSFSTLESCLTAS
jgi:hypothetical protein